LDYSREATANRAPGQPLVFTAPGVFKPAPAGYFNVEVAAAAGGGGGSGGGGGDDDDDDDDDDDGKMFLKSRADRKRKFRGKSLSDGPIKLVRGGGWCDYCNAASANDQESNNAPFGK
jgi:hypothetical protein